MPRELEALRDKKTGNIRMKDAEGGSYAIPENMLNEAFAQGFELETPQGAAVREYVKDNQGVKGALKTFGGQLVDELAMGLPEMIYDKTGDPLEVAKKDALKKEHNIANTVGGGLGFAGSMLVGGPLYKGATKGGVLAKTALQKGFTAKLAAQGVKQKGLKGAAKSLAAKTLDKTAQLGAEGAILSTPYAITEASLAEDVDIGERFGLAAESIAAGGLFGGALGIVGAPMAAAARGILKPVKGVAKAIGGPIKKQFSPKDVVVNVFDPTPTELKRFSEKFKGTMKKHPEFAKGKGDYQEELLKLTKKIGIDIDSVSPDAFLPKVQSYLDDAVSKLDELATNAKGSVSSKSVGKKIVSQLETVKKDMLKGIGGGKSAKKVQQTIDELTDKLIVADRPVTARELLDLKRATSENIKFQKKPGTLTAAEKALSKAVTSFDDGIEELVKKNDPALKNAWRENNLEVSTLIDVIEPLKRKAGRDIKRPFAGVGNLTAVGGGAVVGGPVGAAIGAGLSPVFRDYRNYGILYAENAMKKIANGLDSIPGALKSQIDKGKRVGFRKANTEVAKQRTSTALRAGTRLLGDTQPERLKEYERIRERVLQFSEDPEYAASQVGEVTGTLSETGAPQIAEAFARKNALMAQYFGAQVPKSTRPDTPYYKTKHVPSDTELSRFERKLRVIQNPFTVVQDLEQGSLTSEAVDTLKNVYPALFRRIQGKVIDSLMEEKENVPYETRLQLALILEEPTDPSLENIGMYQQTFAQEEQEQQQPSGNMDIPSIETETQRITGK